MSSIVSIGIITKEEKKLSGKWHRRKRVSLFGEYRDYLGCSRKVAVALLEHFDKNGFTRKKEEGRVLKDSGKQRPDRT